MSYSSCTRQPERSSICNYRKFAHTAVYFPNIDRKCKPTEKLLRFCKNHCNRQDEILCENLFVMNQKGQSQFDNASVSEWWGTTVVRRSLPTDGHSHL